MAYAPSEGNVATYFGPYLYRSNFDSTSAGAQPIYRGGLGWVVLGDVSDRGSLEVGVFYLNKDYYRKQAGAEVVQTTGLYHITMGYRWWLSPSFSTSLSFSSGYSAGDPKITHSTVAPGAVLDTSAGDTTEYGFDFALQGELWESGNWGVVLDARYSMSVTAKEGEKADQFGAVLGVRYLLQEKVVTDRSSEKK